MNANISPPITLLPNMLTLMQRIQDAATHGYRYYVTGNIEVKAWPAFALKMDGRYEVGLTRATRSKRRKAGESVCLLYGCNTAPFSSDGRLPWILITCEGRGRVHGSESLRHFERDRLEMGGFELVHDGKCWTWQISASRIRWWRQRIEKIAQHPASRRHIDVDEQGQFDIDIETVMTALYRQPGFRLVRRQIGHLVKFAHFQWARYRPTNGPEIRKRYFLPYIRRLPNSPNSKRP